MSVISINEQQLHDLVKRKGTLLVDFWAPWCGDCRRIEKAYDQIADAYADVMTVVKINVDENPGIREREEIRRIPTLRLYRDGEALGQIVEPPARADIEEFLSGILPGRQHAQDDDIHDMIVIGGGPGGCTAALYAARAGLDVVLLEKLSAGGQMALTRQIDNYPGFEAGVSGAGLGERMQQQAERFGAAVRNALVRRADLQADPKVLETSEGQLRARTVVLATGANPRELGLPGEEALIGHGVAYCAACDGMLYQGKTVVVVGGGNSACADALLLSRIASRVILVHRRDKLRATKVYHAPLMQAENVAFVWNSEVTELLHGEALTGVRIRNVQTGEEREIPCEGLFVSIGRKPASDLAAGQVDMEDGYIAAGETTQTSIPGVYAVGDVRTKQLRQVVTAVADGAMAVHMAEEYLAGLQLPE